MGVASMVLIILPTFGGMFVRKKVNRSGTTSVVIVSKSGSSHSYIKTIGISNNPEEIARLVEEGKLWIYNNECQNQLELDFERECEKRKQERLNIVKDVISNVEHVLLNGPEYILTKTFDSIGFNAISDSIFRNLVIARLVFPSSKRATVEYLKSYFDEDLELHKIYRYLSKLNEENQHLIQKISVNHTLHIHGGTLGVLFYDVTTLYFETDKSDALRQTGFSKDGKHSNPQIVLGLLVSADGCPLAYSINAGKQYEGHTLLPTIEDFIKIYKLENFIIVADSGMLNNDNIVELEKKGYEYIIGARIKNIDKQIKDWILSLDMQDGQLEEKDISKKNDVQNTENEEKEQVEKKEAKKRLIIGYSAQRAKKDSHNRDKGIKRLQKKFASGILSKNNITQRGYNKFLTITGNDELTVVIDQDKIEEDEKWDGLKGYITNTTIKASEVLAAYNNLYNVEKSFRICKHSLETRPIFLFNPDRIKAHIAICFVALKVYRELERILKMNHMPLSVDSVLKIAKTIVTIKVRLNNDKYDDDNIYTQRLFLTDKHKLIASLFEESFWVSQNTSDSQPYNIY